jgi:PIN domain nuclease of toxin-antitoxin system
MKILVDTHILILSFTDPDKLKPKITNILKDEANDIYYSQVSLWEISIKYALGKMTINGMNPEEFYEEISNSYYNEKTIKSNELITYYKLPIEHRDPFDRLLIWQAIKNEFIFISEDGKIPEYKKYGLKTI